MPVNEREEIAGYVDDLLEATTAGRIRWTDVNPSTFVAITSSNAGPAQLVLQRIERGVVRERKDAAGIVLHTPEKRITHSLTVANQPRDMNIVIDGEADPRMDEKLGALYAQATERVISVKLDFLRSTLPKQP